MIYFKLTLMATVWGAAFVGVRYVAQFVGPFTGAAIRFGLAAMVLAIIMRGQKLPPLNAPQWRDILLLAFSGIFAYNALLFVGMKEVETARGALIIAIIPAITAITAALFAGEPLSYRQIMGLAASLLGSAMVIFKEGGQQLGVGMGELALLGSVFCFVAYSLTGKRILSALPSLSVAFAATACGALMLTFMALTEWVEELPQMPLLAWLWLIFMAVISTGMGNLWYFQGIAAIGVGRAANFINLTPVFAALLGGLFLDEVPTGRVIFGGGLVIAGVIAVNWQATQK